MDTKTSKADLLAYAISVYMYREGLETIEVSPVDIKRFGLTGKQLMAGSLEGKYILSLIDAVPSKK